jgi:hypothetical protein
VIAAVLFEFCLRELRLRTQAEQADQTLSAVRWLHPAERIRVRLCPAAGEQSSAEAATGQVRVADAARRLYQLRTALAASHQRAKRGAVAASCIRRAERRAHRALTRAGFADPDTAAAVLRQVQVLTMTTTLASLDYRTADAAHAALTHMIASPGPAPGASAGDSEDHGDSGAELVAAATRIVAEATRDGARLSQVALAARLRSQGYTVANSRLRWLSVVSGLVPSNGTEPGRQLRGTGNGTE